MVKRIIEYLRLGRIFNAEILALLYVLTYIFTSELYGFEIEFKIIVGLFVVGILSHIWGAYNNDRLDLCIDKGADYCSHKPLVSGSISIKQAKIIEYSILLIIIALVLVMSPKLVTLGYLFGAYLLAYLYNRYNKSSMFINVIGQMYASFAVLVSMSFVVNFDYIVFLSAIVIGLNGIYLNIIEADYKDIRGDIVNVPRSLGLRFKENKAVNITWFYIVNEIIKIIMYVLVFYILYLENTELFVKIIAIIFFALNFVVRILMFRKLTPNREKMKPFFALQEFTSILFISIIYVIIHPVLPLIIILFVILWLSIWNKILWGTYFRPQV
jgi:4-hydroxybenzoate polyprenyltransferase